jgi:hypothetical protein
MKKTANHPRNENEPTTSSPSTSSSASSNAPPLRTWERRVQECKKKHRPKLKDWQRDEFGTKRLNSFEELKFKYVTDDQLSIERIESRHLTVENFISKYERNSIPLIIRNIPKEEHWKAGLQLVKKILLTPFIDEKWDFDKFHHIRNRYFKVGEDDDGYSVKV